MRAIAGPAPAGPWVLSAVFAGDMIGAAYEKRLPEKPDFELFGAASRPTDDTVLTLAVARAVLAERGDEEATRRAVRDEIIAAFDRYPRAGYGARFISWALDPDPEPYGSLADGAAMRVSSVAWVYDTLEDVERFADVTASVTHNHPDGMRGARCVAGLTFAARCGASKAEIRDLAQKRYGYDLSDTATDWDAVCNFEKRSLIWRSSHAAWAAYAVPRSVRAFLQSSSLEEALRFAVLLGGDTDTQGAMTGAIAHAYYGDPAPEMVGAVRSRLGEGLSAEYEAVRKALLERFAQAL